jgi:hypothetical protein
MVRGISNLAEDWRWLAQRIDSYRVKLPFLARGENETLSQAHRLAEGCQFPTKRSATKCLEYSMIVVARAAPPWRERSWKRRKRSFTLTRHGLPKKRGLLHERRRCAANFRRAGIGR